MRILLAFAALLVLAAGCSGHVPEPGPGDAAVLMADLRRGLAPASDRYDPPDFVLYADGRAVVQEETRLVEYHLTPERVRALFEEADDAGLFDDEDHTLDGEVADGGVLVLALRTTEREHVAKVVLPNPDDGGARGAAAAFAASLRPSEWAESVPYRPGRVAVVYDVVTSATEEPRPWPLAEREPFEWGCVVHTGAAAARAQELGETEPNTVLWRHDDVTFHAWVRPLLPDEADCRASERRHDG